MGTFGFETRFDGLRLNSPCAVTTACGVGNCHCAYHANQVAGVVMNLNDNFTFFSDYAVSGSGFTICARPVWPQQNDSLCTLPIFSRRIGVTYQFTLVSDPDEVGSLPRRSDVNSDLDVAAPANTNLTVGLVYRFNPPNNSDNSVGWDSYLQNVDGNVTYSIRVLGPAVAATDILVNSASGFVSLAPTAAYTASVQLFAVVSSGETAVLRNWTVTSHNADTVNPANGPGGVDCRHGVRADGTRYDGAYTCNCSGSGFTGTLCDIPDTQPQLRLRPWRQVLPDDAARVQYITSSNGQLSRTRWAVNTTYRIAPINVTTGGYTDESPHSNLSVSFSLRWYNSTAPRGFFIDPNSGEMLVEIPERQQELYLASVIAEAVGTQPLILYNITFHFLQADVATPTNGPGGRDCFGGSDQRVDGVEFDQSYTCTCPQDGSTQGPNCEFAQAATGTDTTATNSAYAVVGVIGAILLIVAAVARWQVIRARNRPINLSALQQELLEALGNGNHALSIQPHEVGMTLRFDNAGSGMNQNLSQSEIDERSGRLSIELLSSLRQQTGLPQRLSAMLRSNTTGVEVDLVAGAATLKMQRPKDPLKRGSEELFASVLNERARLQKLNPRTGVESNVIVHEVSIAVAQRVPHEIDRRTVLRLGHLGEGNFGEVAILLSSRERVGRLSDMNSICRYSKRQLNRTVGAD